MGVFLLLWRRGQPTDGLTAGDGDIGCVDAAACVHIISAGCLSRCLDSLPAHDRYVGRISPPACVHIADIDIRLRDEREPFEREQGDQQDVNAHAYPTRKPEVHHPAQKWIPPLAIYERFSNGRPLNG